MRIYLYMSNSYLEQCEIMRYNYRMKWVVFRGIGGDEDSKKVVSYLRKKKVRYKTFRFDLEHLSDPDDKHMSKTIITLCEILADATHIVLVNMNQIPIVGTFLYTLGLISHSSVSVFVVGDRPGLPACLTNGFFPACIDIDELYDRLDKYFPIFKEEEKKELARHQLFSLNIPLNADSFSQYICSANIEVCELFIAAGMDVNSIDAAGTPMLGNAARVGNLQMVKWLLTKSADINAVSKDRGYTALMDAIWKNKEDLVGYLVEQGAALDTISKDGQPIAVLATGSGNAEICSILAKNGADINKKDNLGMSALDYANLFKNEALIEAFSSGQK